MRLHSPNFGFQLLRLLAHLNPLSFPSSLPESFAIPILILRLHSPNSVFQFSRFEAYLNPTSSRFESQSVDVPNIPTQRGSAPEEMPRKTQPFFSASFRHGLSHRYSLPSPLPARF